MRTATRFSLSSASIVIVACAGSSAWKDTCACAPQWTVVAMDLQNPPPWHEDMVTPSAVSESTRAYFNSRHIPVTLETMRALGPAFNDGCVRELITRLLTCTFWLWHKEKQERGLQLEVHESSEPANLAADGVKSNYVFRDQRR